MHKILNIFKSFIGGIVSLLFVILVIVVWSAELKSCFFESNGGSSEKPIKLDIVTASLENINHLKLIGRIKNIYLSLGLPIDNFEVYFINDDNCINAASYGNNKYLVWENISNLPGINLAPSVNVIPGN